MKSLIALVSIMKVLGNDAVKARTKYTTPWHGGCTVFWAGADQKDATATMPISRSRRKCILGGLSRKILCTCTQKAMLLQDVPNVWPYSKVKSTHSIALMWFQRQTPKVRGLVRNIWACQFGMTKVTSCIFNSAPVMSIPVKELPWNTAIDTSMGHILAVGRANVTRMMQMVPQSQCQMLLSCPVRAMLSPHPILQICELLT
mmetsp:Transcript_19511/g.32571  ORF Transcript_19511/g.32571 Transcript_19511/m.32571 type:complete len:202 (+) Transcript_19511:111-716(+)